MSLRSEDVMLFRVHGEEVALRIAGKSSNRLFSVLLISRARQG